MWGPGFGVFTGFVGTSADGTHVYFTSEGKVGTTIVKSCNAPTLDATGVFAADGLGFDVHGPVCAGLGVPTLATLADVTTCTTRLHECRALQLLENQTPRLRELLDIGAASLP